MVEWAHEGFRLWVREGRPLAEGPSPPVLRAPSETKPWHVEIMGFLRGTTNNGLHRALTTFGIGIRCQFEPQVGPDGLVSFCVTPDSHEHGERVFAWVAQRPAVLGCEAGALAAR